MKRAILAAAVVPILAGCFANAIRAQEPAPAARTITVSGHASVERVPDQATVLFAVETEAASAQDASDTNATAMAAVLDTLEAAGVDRGAIGTQGLRVVPEHSYPREGQQRRITGYRATNQVRVTVNDLPRIGMLVEAALAAGANRVEGVSFTLSDADETRLDALRTAVEQARAEATAIADALGEPLGAVLSVTTSPTASRGVAARAATFEASAMRPAPPVEPGTIEVQATVTVVFRIGRP